MKILSIDIETYSSADLVKCGIYRYVEAADFEILLFAYAADGGAVRVVDLASGEKLPDEIRAAIIDPTVTKWAFNALFERVCLSRYLGKKLKPESWHCSMVWAAMLGLPLSLDGVGAVLGLEKKKMKEGKDLIRYFSVPCKATKTNGERTRNLPCHALEKWALFKEYNARDVEVEMAIQEKLAKFPVPETEWKNYTLDQQINDRGIWLDMSLVKRAIECDDQFRNAHIFEARSLTGLENPNSTQQLKTWLEDKGLTVDSLSKASVGDLLADAVGEVERVLLLRRELAKSSVKKYTAMENAVCRDGRAHGLIQFYGANRTGRYSGRLIQVHNLPQNHLTDLAQARSLIKGGQFDVVDMLYDSVPLVLSELIRTAFIPKDGCRFYIADFSAIEARVIAWLAGEKWRQDVFASHGKIYEASASQMFHVPIEEITKGSPLRQKGKIAELALGYGGSVGALTAMGALVMGVPEAELQPLVKAWRSANPHIVQLWWDVDREVQEAVKKRTTTRFGGLTFSCQSGILFIQLPSGRRLAYAFTRMYEHSKKGAAIYVFHADSEGYNFRNAFKLAGYQLRQCLVWVKSSLVMGKQDYQWQHEPILYGWKDGAGHVWYGDRKQTTLVKFDKPHRNGEHPTMKPVGLCGYFIANSSKEGDIVLDLFGGSGSTLIACEQTGRICYTSELDPKYCDVIVKRYIEQAGGDCAVFLLHGTEKIPYTEILTCNSTGTE